MIDKISLGVPMLNIRFVLSLLFTFIIETTQVLAINQSTVIVNVQKKIQVNKFQVGIGSEVEMRSDDQSISGEALFLGKAVSPSGRQSYQMYLHMASRKIFYIDGDLLKRSVLTFQALLDPYEQAGGTCTGYAIYDYLEQTNLAGFIGNGELAKSLATEEGRSTLLVDSINQYYLNLQHRNSITGIMNSYGRKFGFQCKNFKTNSYLKAKDVIVSQLRNGNPVILSFDIGPKMAKSPFQLNYYLQTNPELDDRLWIPRKIGERNSGGHSIVAAAAFDYQGKSYLIMLDSDWSQPRVWDMEAFLSGKTDLASIDFIFCK